MKLPFEFFRQQDGMHGQHVDDYGGPYSDFPTTESKAATNFMRDIFMRQRKLNVILLTLVALVCRASWSAEAVKQPRYRLVEGKGYTVCEAFLKNLNAFPPDEPPMICEQKIHPKHPEFSRPKWEDMDVQSNLQLIYEAEGKLQQFTPVPTKPKPYSVWEKAFQERVKKQAAQPWLHKAVIDMGVKGPETVLIYNAEDRCREIWDEYRYVDASSAPSTGGSIFILDSKSGHVTETIPTSLGDIWLYDGKKPYIVGVNANRREGVSISLSPVGQSLSHDGKYVFSGPSRCRARVDLNLKPQ